VSSVGSFFSYVNDARSHEPEINKYIKKIVRHVGHLPRSVVKFNTRAHNINTVVLTEMTTLVTFQLSENNACCQDKTNGVSVGQSQRITPHIHGLCRLRHTRIRGVSVYFSPEDRGSSSVWNVSSILPDYTMSTQADSSPHCKGHERLKSQWT